jgi:hypothetical protein
METEQIVRALAKADAPLDEVYCCLLCAAEWKAGEQDPEEMGEPQHHDTGCPWRLAREWVAAHPA